MRGAFAVIVVYALPAVAADGLLDLAKQNVVERFQNAPNFTCRLEIERTVFPTRLSTYFQSRDRYRLEVAVTDGHERFAWPGESFTERPLAEFLGPGIASTGEFSTHGITVFTDSRTSIARSPQKRVDNRLYFTFRVPVEASRYMLFAAGHGVPMPAAYEGGFYIDQDSAQLLSLDVDVPHPPAASGLARIATAIDYSQAEVGGDRVWLPSEARIEVESLQGALARNRLRFSSCRSYQTAANIRFSNEENKEDVIASPGPALQSVDLPTGSELPLELRESISSDGAWAGDVFLARLYKDVKSSGTIILPKGAVITGRLVRIETIDTTPTVATKDKVRRMTAISLSLTEARWKDHTARVDATMQLVERIPLMARVDPVGRADIDPGRSATNRAFVYETSEEMSEPGSGTFLIYREIFVVRSGTRMRWITR
jgi:hypothetical protein